MKRQNRAGPALLGDAAPLPLLDRAALQTLTHPVLLDTRPRAAYQASAPLGSVNIPDGNTFETWSGWLLRPEDGPLVLLAGDAAHAERLRRRLWMVGLDDVAGYVTDTTDLPAAPARPFPARELPQHRGALILDVRNKTEHQAGAIPGAQQLHAGRLAWHLDTLPRDQEIVVHCQGGARSAAAASLLRTRGFQVTELDGGYDAYTRERDAQPVSPA